MYAREYSCALLCTLTSMQPASIHKYVYVCVCVCVCIPTHLSEVFMKYPVRIPARIPEVLIVLPCLALLSPSNDRTVGIVHQTLAAHGQRIVFYSSPLHKLLPAASNCTYVMSYLGTAALKVRRPSFKTVLYASVKSS